MSNTSHKPALAPGHPHDPHARADQQQDQSTDCPKPAMVVTLDGPAASGKSSVSRELARRLGWKWVSTGAFYRGLAYAAMREGLLVESSAALPAARLAELAKQSSIWDVRLDADLTRVFYRGIDVSNEVFAEGYGFWASRVSQLPEVRQALLQNQRDSALGVAGLVAEGRDCGTVVFPQAAVKVFLTASHAERAARRAREQGLNQAEIEKQQRERDQADSNRAAAPLQIPDGAHVLDSNGIPIAGVVDQILVWVKEAMARSVKSF